ncbi:MAG: histidine triad nucleotide-binding protein [Herbaspirillum sp.]|nr:histidine triad nucleotide-binding protein [Herbaspirillum sp.]
MDNCLFCKIAAGQIPSKVLYEDDEVKVFNDIRPAAPVHFLIIPKEHIETLSDCEERHAGLLGKMLLLGKRLAHEQGCDYRVGADGVKTGGYKTMINTGPNGGQEVYHLHLHIIGGPHPWNAPFLKV